LGTQQDRKKKCLRKTNLIESPNLALAAVLFVYDKL